MKKTTTLITALAFVIIGKINAQTSLPTPDHVLVVLLENYGYSEIIGSSNAPYINSLYANPATATFTQSYALTHPSLPNYLDLYCGNNYGVTSDNIPTNTPWTYCNLGASVITKGLTWGAYSETLPSVGFTGTSSGNYAEKHCPWVIFQGTGTNNVPASTNMPFTSFPDSLHYSNLPTVCFVIPNMVDDMHDPSYNAPTAISNGDAWVKNHLGSVIRWCQSNNSLFILTFDEDDGIIIGGVQTTSNQIVTMFIGGMVNGGHYANKINHFSVLRTIEDMYALPQCDSSAFYGPITNVWNTTGIQQHTSNNSISVYPVPTSEKLNINITADTEDKTVLTITDLSGKVVKEEELTIVSGNNAIETNVKNLSNGFYFLKLTGNHINHTEKFIVDK